MITLGCSRSPCTGAPAAALGSRPLDFVRPGAGVAALWRGPTSWLPATGLPSCRVGLAPEPKVLHTGRYQVRHRSPKLTKGGPSGRPSRTQVGVRLVRQPEPATPREHTGRARREEEADPARHRRPDWERALAPRRGHRNHRLRADD